jgi:AAA domain/Protein kinase domain
VASAQFLGGKYRIERPIVRGDRSGRLPSLYEVSDAGLFLFARTWARSSDSADLRALWNHEVRSLLRLGGYPRASDYFVRLKDLGVDEKRFYVILDAGDRQPLTPMLSGRGSRAWLRDVPTPARRRRIWEGLRRVATAVSMLHEEGTLHRAISPASVFSDDRGDCDFRLSGFEWSLRITTPMPVSRGSAHAASTTARLRAPELEKVDARYSFATDWFDFGVLCTEIFGFEPTGRGIKTVERLREVVLNLNYLGPPEKALILGLLELNPEQRFAQSDTILQGLSEAHASVRNRTVVLGRPLYVGFLLGQGSRLSEAIADITQGGNGDIRTDDVDKQVAFIQKDLTGDLQVLIRQTPYQHYFVNGRLLQYRVQRWDRPDVQTWDVGFCSVAEPPSLDPAERVALLDGRKIEVRAAPRLMRDLNRARSMGAAWDAVFPFETTVSELEDSQRQVWEFFRITNQLDALLAAAQIWPVRIVTVDEEAEGARVEVTPTPESERNNLALNLKLPRSDEQMREFFSRDSTSLPLAEEASYTLAYEGILGRGEEETNIRWRFDRTIPHPSGIRYRFFHEDAGLPAPVLDSRMFLMPVGLAGTVAQLYRRQRAIEAMRSHGGLLSAISDPDRERRDTADAPGTSPDISALDQSKQLALNGIWQTQPVYAVQGPPGTGKTKLLETMTTRLLETDVSTQALITAHSHEAVRHVHRNLSARISSLPPATRPIVIRLDDKDDNDHVRHAAGRLALAIAKSQLAAEAPSHIRDRADLIASDIKEGSPPTRDIRSLESLVRQAANVVFATSNSGELAQMLEDNRRFDWSIIEEAGKAHGFDLALALQASYRVLMIGDQEQLPPFNFATLEALFREPLRILNALKNGASFAPGLVGREYVSLDEDDQQKFADGCAVWLDMVQFFAEMFRRCEQSVVNDVPIAMQLELQHRMHPTICELISYCFYRKKLKTHEDAIERFKSEAPPFSIINGGWMPEERIVFVDMPWIQEVPHATGEEGGSEGKRRYTNSSEVEAVCRALSQFSSVTGVECHIQVLSPYRAQVRQIVAAVKDEIASGKLANLTTPEFDIWQSKRIGATVDEFQGSEADIVVASLVRNNDEKIGKGLGFLADRRRFNVLLSRARHKLVLVGSWNFLSSRVDCSVEPNEEEELAHVARLMRWLSDEQKAGRVKRVPVNSTFWGRTK